MPSLVLRPRALDDLAEIWGYIARQSADDSPDRADAFVDLVDSKFQALSRRPGLGRRRPELNSEIRSLAVGRYVVFYLPLSRGIEVVRVLHGSRDIESQVLRVSLPTELFCAVYIHFAALHNEGYFFHHSDIGQWIAIDGYDIGELSGLDGADVIGASG
jgi:toxin ParE1/3/4